MNLDNMVDLFGGYNTWQYAVAVIGGLFVGGIISTFGLVGLVVGLLMYFTGGLLLLHQITELANIASTAAPMAGVAPALFIAALLITATCLTAQNSIFRDKENRESK